MNIALYIARRLWNGKHNSFSRSILNVATISIALSLAVMILSIAVLTGFKNKITEKVLGFSPHIQVGVFDMSQSLESTPMINSETVDTLKQNVKGIKHIQVFAYKGGLVKTEDLTQGFALKGVDSDYDWFFFASNLKEGRLPLINDTSTSNEILVSKKFADKLSLKLNDKFRAYFLSDGQLRARAFSVCGIYNSGFSDFDEKIVLGDIKQIRKLNNWSDNSSEGLEIYLDNFNEQDKIAAEIFDLLDYNQTVTTIKELHGDIFSWLNLMDTNVILILVILAILIFITMISALLVLIVESVNMIGILKAMGAHSGIIRKMFLWESAFVLGRGLLWGNGVALLLYFLQTQFSIIKLNPDSYHVAVVPLEINIFIILLVNIVILAISILLLIIPTNLISRIDPAKSIRFD